MNADYFNPDAAADPVWRQHLYWVLGQPEIYLILLLLLVAVVALIAIRIVRDREIPKNKVALAFLIYGIALLVLGGISVRQLSNMSVTGAYHDTYYVVAHFHYVMGLAVMPFVFALAYFLYRLVIGVPYRRSLGWAHWGLYCLGSSLMAGPQLIWQSSSADRAFESVESVMQELDRTALLHSIAVIVTLTSVLIFAICLIEGLYRRIKHGRQPIDP